MICEDPEDCLVFMVPLKTLLNRIYTDKKQLQEAQEKNPDSIDPDVLKEQITNNEKLKNLIRRRILNETDTSKILKALAAHKMFSKVIS